MATFYRVRLGWFKKDRIQDRDEIDCMANGRSIVWFSRNQCVVAYMKCAYDQVKLVFIDAELHLLTYVCVSHPV